MHPIRYVHAANLRLDTPLAGLPGTVPDSVDRRLAEAPYTALTRLVALCDRERPDFLLLTGNTLNAHSPLLASRLHLHEACTTLARLGVTVVIRPETACPPAQWARLRELPANVQVLADDGELNICRNGQPVIRLRPAPLPPATGCLEPLHCETALAAPATEQGKDALPVLLCPDVPPAATLLSDAPLSDVPLSASPRPDAIQTHATQGLGFHEPGLYGCVLTEATPHPDGLRLAHRPVPLSAVIWRTVGIRLDNAPADLQPAPPEALADTRPDTCADTRAEIPAGTLADAPHADIDQLAGRLSRRLGAETAGLPAGCELVVLRLRLEGVTPLNAHLRQPRLRERLLERLRESGPLLWPAVLDCRTTPPPSPAADASATRRDLTGELVRLADRLQHELQETPQHDPHPQPAPPTARLAEALAPLYACPPARLTLPPPDAATLRELVRSAAELCREQLDATTGRLNRETL